MFSILATGLTGLVGSRIVELNPDLQFTDLSLETGFNILQPVTLEDIFKNNSSNLVLHLAAFTDTNAAWNQKGDQSGPCYQINVVGTQNVANLCRKYNKHLIHISTDFVFDGSKTGPYLEADTPNPLDWYGQTKLEAEKVAATIDATVIRIAFPYRAKFDPKVDFVRKIISKLSQNQVCNLFEDQTTTPTFIDDIAACLGQVFKNPKSGIYHLVGSSSQSIYSLGQQIAQTFDFSLDLVKPSSLADYLKTPDARPYPSNLALSNQKFITDFGFTPATLPEGLLKIKQQLS